MPYVTIYHLLLVNYNDLKKDLFEVGLLFLIILRSYL